MDKSDPLATMYGEAGSSAVLYRSYVKENKHRWLSSSWLMEAEDLSEIRRTQTQSTNFSWNSPLVGDYCYYRIVQTKNLVFINLCWLWRNAARKITVDVSAGYTDGLRYPEIHIEQQAMTQTAVISTAGSDTHHSPIFWFLKDQKINKWQT